MPFDLHEPKRPDYDPPRISPIAIGWAMVGGIALWSVVLFAIWWAR